MPFFFKREQNHLATSAELFSVDLKRTLLLIEATLFHLVSEGLFHKE
jgi:hypothetical protein